jgi:hypothetical protein
MKQLLTIFVLLCSLSISAQGTYTTTAGTISPTQPDTIVVVKDALQVEPVLINALTKDTCYQLIWNVQNVTRDTTQGSPCYVNMYDRGGRNFGQVNCYIPKEVINAWGTSNTIIDDYVLAYFGFRRRGTSKSK